MNKYIVETWETITVFRKYRYKVEADNALDVESLILNGDYEEVEMLEELPTSDNPEEIEIDYVELLNNSN